MSDEPAAEVPPTMALTQTRTERESSETIAVPPRPALERILSSSDHKTIGQMWIGAGVGVTVLALLLAASAAFEHISLASSNGSLDLFEDEGQFVQAWSAGRTLLFFGGIVPVLVGIATYLAPLQVGASAIAFGRGAAAAFWTWILGTGVLGLSYIINGGPGGGAKDAVLLWALSLGTMLVAICWALICVATTILGARASGMRLDHLPTSTWSFLLFALSGLLTLPILVGELGLVYADVTADYLASKESRLALLSVMDSVSLAPALYWVGIPILGMGLDVLTTQTGSKLRLHKPALVLLGLLPITSFSAEVLTFGGRGRPIDFNNASLVVGIIGSALPILLLLAVGLDSARQGSIKVNTPFVGSLLGLILLAAAAVVALLAQIEPVVGFFEMVGDSSINLSPALELNGSAFSDGVRGLVLGSVLVGLIGTIHHWGHKIWGRTLSDQLGLLTVLLALVGTVAWGGAYAVSGLLEQPALPRTVAGPKDGVEALNAVAMVGFVALALAALLLLVNIARTAFAKGSTSESWSGTSLEWATSSPPPVGNFPEAPVFTPLVAGKSMAGDDQTGETR